MVGHEPAAVFHVLLEGRLHLVRPLVPGGELVVITDHELVLLELRTKGAEVAANEKLPIGLKGHGIDRLVRTDGWIEAGINRASGSAGRLIVNNRHRRGADQTDDSIGRAIVPIAWIDQSKIHRLDSLRDRVVDQADTECLA